MALSPSSNGKITQLLYDEESQKIIKKYTLLATGAGFVPIPVASSAAAVAAQVYMIKDLCEQFNIPFDKKTTSVVINSVIGSVLSKAISMAINTVVPVSSLAGMDFSSAAISGLYTATVGEFYKVHFQNGGTLADASIGDLGKYFMEEIERGDIGISNLTNPTSFMKNLLK